MGFSVGGFPASMIGLSSVAGELIADVLGAMLLLVIHRMIVRS